MEDAGLLDQVQPKLFLCQAHIGAADPIEGKAAVAGFVQRDHGDRGVFRRIQNHARRVDADLIQNALEPVPDEIAAGLGEEGRFQTHPRAAGQHIRRGAARVASNLYARIRTRNRIDQDFTQRTNIIHKRILRYFFLSQFIN